MERCMSTIYTVYNFKEMLLEQKFRKSLTYDLYIEYHLEDHTSRGFSSLSPSSPMKRIKKRMLLKSKEIKYLSPTL